MTGVYIQIGPGHFSIAIPKPGVKEHTPQADEIAAWVGSKRLVIGEISGQSLTLAEHQLGSRSRGSTLTQPRPQNSFQSLNWSKPEGIASHQKILVTDFVVLDGVMHLDLDRDVMVAQPVTISAKSDLTRNNSPLQPAQLDKGLARLRDLAAEVNRLRQQAGPGVVLRIDDTGTLKVSVLQDL